MLVREAMSAPALSARDDIPVTTARRRVRRRRTVKEPRRRRPLTVPIDADLADAVELMSKPSVESLLVVDDHARVVGVIRRRDVFRLLARPDRVVDAEVDDLFRRLSLVRYVEVRDGEVTPTGRRVRNRAAPAATLA